MNLTKSVSADKGAGMTAAVIYILISVIGCSIGQLLLKKGMNSLGEITLSLPQLPAILWNMGTNPNVFFGLAIYGAGTVFWLAALSRVDLSYAYPFASLTYVVILIGSWLMFDERITLFRIIGTGVIGLGVLLIYRN